MNDLIERQSVLNACEQSINILEAVDRIMDLPSVEQEPKTEQEDDYFRKIVEVAISQLRADRDRLEDELAKREQEPCEDAISRQAVLDGIEELKKSPWATANRSHGYEYLITEALGVVADLCVKQASSVNPQEKTGHCKDCKYFEYDSVAKVDGVPLIVAHEICSRWGDGCKTREDGYCFLFEPQEREDKE